MSSITPYEPSNHSGIIPYVGSPNPLSSFDSSALSFSSQSQFAYVPQSTAFMDLAKITSASLNLNDSLLNGCEDWERSLGLDDLNLELGSAMEFDDLDFSFDL